MLCRMVVVLLLNSAWSYNTDQTGFDPRGNPPAVQQEYHGLRATFSWNYTISAMETLNYVSCGYYTSNSTLIRIVKYSAKFGGQVIENQPDASLKARLQTRQRPGMIEWWISNLQDRDGRTYACTMLYTKIKDDTLHVIYSSDSLLVVLQSSKGGLSISVPVFDTVSKSTFQLDPLYLNASVVFATVSATDPSGPVTYSISKVKLATKGGKTPLQSELPTPHKWLQENTNDCFTSTKLSSPRNKFCIDFSKGAIHATSSYFKGNLTKENDKYEVTITATNKINQTTNLIIYFQLSSLCFTFFVTDLNQIKANCSPGFTESKGTHNIVQEIAEVTVPKDSMIVMLTFTGFYNQGTKGSTFSFPDNITFSISVYNEPVSVTLLYNDPPWNIPATDNITLPTPSIVYQSNPTEKIQIEVHASSGKKLFLQSADFVVYTISLRDYCRDTKCVNAFADFNRTLQLKGFGRCVKELDKQTLEARYGHCDDNLPPVIYPGSGITTDLKVTQPISRGTIITRVNATDPEGKKLSYHIMSINGSNTDSYQTYDCSDTESGLFCIERSTGIIKLALAGEKLIKKTPFPGGTKITVDVIVSDHGKPYRESFAQYIIEMQDDCSPVSNWLHYLKLSNCLENTIASSPSQSGSAVEFKGPQLFDVIYELIFNNLQFPANATTIKITGIDNMGYSLFKYFDLSSESIAFGLGKRTFKVDFQFRSSKSITISAVSITSTLKSNVMTLKSQDVTAVGYLASTFCSNATCMELTVKLLKDYYGLPNYQDRIRCVNENQVLAKMSCLASPKIVEEPQNRTASMSSKGPKQRVYLDCGYLSRTKPKISWLKDKKPIDTTGMIPWVRREMRAILETNSRTLDFKATNGNQQGFYQCKLETPLSTVSSDAAVVFYDDVSTSNVTLHITNRALTEALDDPSSNARRMLESEIVSQIAVPIRNELGLPKQNPTFSIHSVRSGSIIVNGNLYLPKVETNETRMEVYEKLSNIQPATKDLVIDWKRSRLVSYDCCDSIITGDEKIKGEFHWQRTPVHGDKQMPCPYNSPHDLQFATKQCGINYDLSPIWLPTNDSACQFKSKTTQDLSELSQVVVNSSNVENVVDRLYNLTEDPTSITNQLDVVFTAHVMVSVKYGGTKSQKTIDKLVGVLSSIASADSMSLAKAQVKYQSSSRILKSMQSIVNDHPFPETVNETVSVVRPNASFAVTFIEHQPSTGLSITIQNGSYVLSRGLNDSSTPLSDPSIYLPASVLKIAADSRGTADAKSPIRVTSFSYPSDSLFLGASTMKSLLEDHRPSFMRLSSSVLSASLGYMIIRNLSEPIRSVFRAPHSPTSNSNQSKPLCVFWDFSKAGFKGGWSSDGCIRGEAVGSKSVCYCNHLTNFAVVIDVGNPKNAISNLALDIVTYIGIGISIACLMMTLLSYLIFKSVRRSLPPRILMSLCTALLGVYIIFAIGINHTSPVIGCRIVAMLIHYFLLATFLWMAAEGLNLYHCFVKVVGYRPPRFMLKASVVCWGLPFVVVFISAVSKVSNYGSANNCMVHSATFYVALLAPVILVMLANFIVLGLVLHGVRNGGSISKGKKLDLRAQARVALGCTMLLGLSWIVGVFAIGDLRMAFQWLFCLCNCFQGLFIFIFYCIRNEDIIKEWRRFIGMRATYDKDSGTGSTATKRKHHNGKGDSAGVLMHESNLAHSDSP